ncbi:MAG: hypothetical protein JRJ37_01205 [Deltaproteobacteria bacterium]|nr:hypothetical protein [Deltaproteobacteria bacterium]
MSFQREVDIEVQSNTWPNLKSIPTELTLLQKNSPKVLNVLLTLLYTAIWTRPPVQLGFSLSDCWAWLRYFPAIDNQNILKLTQEWSHIDPHQKTILSDDFGVGVSTWLLHETLDFKYYVDTIYLLNTLNPGLFYLGKTSKRGPNKSPDFIAIDSKNRFSVIECKGTQSSRDALRKALSRGIPQKSNLHSSGKTKIQNSLVSGIFIPQWENNERPLFAVCDPEWKEFINIFKDFSSDQILTGIFKVSLAKEFAILGLFNTYKFLINPESQFSSFDEEFKSDLSGESGISPNRFEDKIQFQHSQTFGEPFFDKDDKYQKVVFKTMIKMEIIEELRISKTSDNLFAFVEDRIKSNEWISEAGNTGVKLTSPLGFHYSMSLD